MSLPYVKLHVDEAFLSSVREVTSIQATTTTLLKIDSTSPEMLVRRIPRAVGMCEIAGGEFHHRNRPTILPHVNT